MPQGGCAHVREHRPAHAADVQHVGERSATAPYRASRLLRRTSMSLRRSVIPHASNAPYGRGMTTSSTSTTSLAAATEQLRSGLKAQLGAVLDSLDAGAMNSGAARGPPRQSATRRQTALPDARGGSVTLAGLRSGPGRRRVLPRRLVPVLQPPCARSRPRFRTSTRPAPGSSRSLRRRPTTRSRSQSRRSWRSRC